MSRAPDERPRFAHLRTAAHLADWLSFAPTSKVTVWERDPRTGSTQLVCVDDLAIAQVPRVAATIIEVLRTRPTDGHRLHAIAVGAAARAHLISPTLPRHLTLSFDDIVSLGFEALALQEMAEVYRIQLARSQWELEWSAGKWSAVV